jgi:hypothetical protein
MRSQGGKPRGRRTTRAMALRWPSFASSFCSSSNSYDHDISDGIKDFSVEAWRWHWLFPQTTIIVLVLFLFLMMMKSLVQLNYFFFTTIEYSSHLEEEQDAFEKSAERIATLFIGQ